jgi:hypothetical protein
MAVKSRLTPEVLATLGLACLYLAVASGHLQSIDGLTIYRQGHAIAYQHSFHWSPGIDWGGGLRTTSNYGIGLSLLYLPGLLLFSWLRPLVPVPSGPYDFRLLYADPIYALVGPVLQILIAVVTAYLIGRFLRRLGFSTPIVLWGIFLFGLGSPAIVYARSDVAQPLEGLCWLAAIYAVLRLRDTDLVRWGVLAGLALVFAVLARPFEGTMLMVALFALAVGGPIPWRWDRAAWRRVGMVAASFGLAAAFTMLVNVGRFGSPLNFGTGSGWATPLPVGLAGSLISPARGMLWAFPAIILVPLGVRTLWPHHRLTALVLIGLSAALLLNTSLWTWWWGGWNWGLRLFVPALPLLAVLAAAGIDRLRGWARVAVPGAVLLAGFAWAVPGVLTDLLGGYAGTYDGTVGSFKLAAYPPIGAWAFLHHLRAFNLADSSAIDLLWFRLARKSHNLSLIPPAILLIGALLAWKPLLGVAPRTVSRPGVTRSRPLSGEA